ncbi:MAG: methyltransferase domain-containing protein [Anaerolineae bacterium]|nr:methyltransferase domain-containing protein [Anaerolineae bacterium]
MKEKLIRIAGLSMIVDGLLLALGGRSFARVWRLGTEKGAYYDLVLWFASLPQWLLRLLGLVEVTAGLKVLGRAPLSVSALYNAGAGLYSTIDTSWRDWLYADAHRDFDETMAAYLPPDGRILDLGAGTGANLGRLLEIGAPFASYTAVDRTEAMLAQARAKYGHLSQVQWQQLDLQHDPLPPGPFDLIVSSWVLEHLDDPALVVEKAWQQLRAGGHVVLLFEVEDDSWYSRLENRVLGFLDAQQVPAATVRQFPGLKRFDRYAGPFGKLALVVLEKPAG